MPYHDRLHKNHLYSLFYAPRGRNRIYALGMQIAQFYLSPFDRIIGIIGEAGSGKSMLVRGMFPGIELTNDDNGVNVRPLPLLEQDSESQFFAPHTYHVDIRFEMGFTQPHVLADAIWEAVRKGRRVIIEHFDLIYPFLHANANLLVGVGEEIVVTRPTIFGPEPQEIYDLVYTSLPYRLMAHTAEDLCEFYMPKEAMELCKHDDVRHGFILSFDNAPPEINLDELEAKVQDAIDRDLAISYVDEEHISIAGQLHPCTGPRTHVASTGKIVGFRLLKEFVYDPFQNRYLLVGCVGENSEDALPKVREARIHNLVPIM